MRHITSTFLALLLFSTNTQELRAQELIEANQCFPKDGLGVTYQGVYILVNSSKNELKIDHSKSWVGARRDVKETVWIRNREIISPPETLEGFDLSNCFVISFQPDRVIFFNFSGSKGSYYLRFHK
jgi:hypothetical protein